MVRAKSIEIRGV